MKLKDRVYDTPGHTGTVVSHSALPHDAFEGDTVDVRWDATGDIETLPVAALDRDTSGDKPATGAPENLHPCGCPGDVVCSILSNGGEQCSSCGSCWDREDHVFKLRLGPLNEAPYARMNLARITYNYDQAQTQIDGLKDYLKELGKSREKAAEAVAKLAQTDAELLAVSGTTIGFKRLSQIATELHPAVYGFCRWAPPEARNVGRNVPIQTQVGLTLRLAYKPAEHYITELADAMREFNRRFVTDYTPPAGTGQYAGYAALDARAEGYYCHIEFDPADNGRAVAVDHREKVLIEGTLPQVLLYATQYAWWTGGPDTEEEED